MATRSAAPTPARKLAGSSVREAMQLGLFECTPDADAATVARTMAQHTIHCVVVAGVERRTHSGERLRWGIVSDLDLMRGLRPGLEETTAGELAASDVLVVWPTDTLEDATRLRADYDTAHLVVASPRTGRPVGMLSTLDIARAIAV